MHSERQPSPIDAGRLVPVSVGTLVAPRRPFRHGAGSATAPVPPRCPPATGRGLASCPPAFRVESDHDRPPSDRSERPAGTRSIEALTEDFRGRDYITDRSLTTAVFLALELGRPLLLEGEAGVGKTELAKVLAASLGARLIRLQCYEGLDVNTAVYEWNYPRQMLEIRLLEARGEAERRERPRHLRRASSSSAARCSRRSSRPTASRRSC